MTSCNDSFYFLEEMYEKIGDKIREQETLAIKIQVRDNFGRSLLTIRTILERKQNYQNQIFQEFQ